MRRRRGFILVLALSIIAGLAGLITASFGRTVSDVRAADRYVSSQQAHYLAEGGLDVALQWFNAQASPPTCTVVNVGDTVCSVFTSTQDLTLGSWRMGTQRITINAAAGNAGSYTDSYTLSTTASSGGVDVDRQLDMIVRVESFAKYAYFSNKEKSSTGNTIWFTGGQVIEGPLHTNDQLHIWGNPRFDGPVASVNDEIDYARGEGIDKPVFNDSLELGHAVVELPDPSLTDLQSQANLVKTGDTTLEFAGEIVKITNGGITTQVTVSDNPLIFVDNGNLTVKGGTLDGQMTIAGNKDIIIKGSVQYKCDPTDAENDPDCLNADGVVTHNDDLLGMVAKTNVRISTAAPNDLTIHATMMAVQGSFGVDNYNSGSPRGSLRVVGGIIQDTRGAVGTFNGSTGQRVSGYEKDYHYDQRLLDMSPPRYPLVGNYKQLLWYEKLIYPTGSGGTGQSSPSVVDQTSQTVKP